MNLVLLTVDCLRADHLGVLGYSKKTSPNLDCLAAKGVIFSQAISVGAWTPASFISMFTSTYPLMYGGQVSVTNSRTTIAQVLKEHGYNTAAFHSNPWLSSYFGFHKGFDSFSDGISENDVKGLPFKAKELVKRTIGTNGRLYKRLLPIYTSLVHKDLYARAEELNRKAISWVRCNPSNFFLWIHYMDCHEPYFASQIITSSFQRNRLKWLNEKALKEQISLSPEEIRELIHLYDTQLIYVDRQIGFFLRALEQRNFAQNTFIVVSADHGQLFQEHGHFGHGAHLYDELLHVPLIVVGPGLGSGVIGEQVSLLDLSPTILDMLKIEKPKAFLGNSLLPLIMGDRMQGGNTAAISEGDTGDKNSLVQDQRLDMHRRQVSLRIGKWKYIYTEGGGDEMYHLEVDPRETQNMIDIQPEMAEVLRNMVMEHIEFEVKCVPSEENIIKAKVGKLKLSGRL